ncbi:hypothetical protein FQZ97_1245010 [compost metagenome]
MDGRHPAAHRIVDHARAGDQAKAQHVEAGARRCAVPDHQTEVCAAGHFPILPRVDGKALCAVRRRNVVGGPVTEIVAWFGSGMEDTNMLVIVAREQALHLGIGSRRIADQNATRTSAGPRG